MAVLRDYIKIKHGFAFKGDHILTIDNGIVLVTPGNFSIGGGFKEEKCKFFYGEYPVDYVLKPGDLIVTMTDLSKAIDTLGYSALVPNSERTYLHNQRIGLVQIIDDERLDKHYLYWFMRTPYYQKTIAATSSGSTVHHTSPDRIMDIEIEVPDLKKQRSVAMFMDNIESKINTNKQINENLYEQMLSIFNNARRTSAWNKHKLGDVLIFFDNLRKPLSSIQREKMAHIYPYYGAASIVDYVEDYLFDGTYILISEDGANVIDSFGHPLTQYTYGKFWVNNHAHIVKGSNGYSEALVYAMLGTLNMQSIVTGAAQPKINQANLRNFEAVLPESEEAQVLSELLNPMLQQMLHHDQENEKLSELRDILLPQLMSGALDVSAIDL